MLPVHFSSGFAGLRIVTSMYVAPNCDFAGTVHELFPRDWPLSAGILCSLGGDSLTALQNAVQVAQRLLHGDGHDAVQVQFLLAAVEDVASRGGVVFFEFTQ